MNKSQVYFLLLSVTLLGGAGCQCSPGANGSASERTTVSTVPASGPVPAAAPAQPMTAAAPADTAVPAASGASLVRSGSAMAAASDAAQDSLNSGGVIRIDAGAASSVRDSAGNEWLADQGFTGGDVIERPDVVVSNSPVAVIYQTEHYGMESFGWKLPNGRYGVNLYFAETYEGINGPGDRVFDFNVQGQDFKDFDVWKTAGGPERPVVIHSDATVTNGQLVIEFTTKIENPQINGIEIIPLTGNSARGVKPNPAGL